MKKVNLYTDGACEGNPGPGGYGAILEYNGHEKVMSDGNKSTTNNRMELMAAIVGLETLKEPCEVMLYSDSKYLVDAIEKGWLANWRRNNWRKSDKSPVLNVDLWERLIVQLERHKVILNWIKGHNGHPQNERCDRLAVAAAERVMLG